MTDAIPDRPRKGRGAITNRAGRFEPHAREAVDDGWSHPVADDDDDEGDPPPLPTTLLIDTARTVIARNQSPDIGFDRSINPYRGCEHGCVYCFARPTHAYYGLSPGLDFETKIFYKPDVAACLVRELRHPTYTAATMAMGTNTDPYQPVERKLKLTRAVIEVLAKFRHPLGIVTKSALIQRDLDILAPMAASRLASACLSVTTLNGDLARSMEPRAARPERRLATIRALAKAGVPVGVLAAPMIPGLNDHELESILEAAAEAGATTAGYVLIRLPLEIKDLFTEWLQAHAPDRAERVLNLIRDTRGGKLYDSTWGRRQKGGGPYAELLGQRFRLAVAKYGLNKSNWQLDPTQFRPPPLPGDQLSLF